MAETVTRASLQAIEAYKAQETKVKKLLVYDKTSRYNINIISIIIKNVKIICTCYLFATVRLLNISTIMKTKTDNTQLNIDCIMLLIQHPKNISIKNFNIPIGHLVILTFYLLSYFVGNLHLNKIQFIQYNIYLYIIY